MLVLTDNATAVIRSLGTQPQLPDGAGLRIASAGQGAESLSVSAAPTPEEGDQVVENEGARIFLEPEAADMLDEMILDARVDDEGMVEFLLAAQR